MAKYDELPPDEYELARSRSHSIDLDGAVLLPPPHSPPLQAYRDSYQTSARSSLQLSQAQQPQPHHHQHPQQKQEQQAPYDPYHPDAYESYGNHLRYPRADHCSASDLALPLPAFLQPHRKTASTGSIPASVGGGGTDARPASRRARVLRWATALTALLGALLVLYHTSATVSDQWSRTATRVRNTLKGAAQGWGYSVDADLRILATQRTPQYDDPFNPDDLTFTEQECDAYFPGLWKEIDRSVAYYSQPNKTITWDYLEQTCSEPNWTHLRVLIYNNRLYIKDYRQSDFTRTQSTLALLQQSLTSAREPLPNVEFCIGLEDWPGRGKFGLDRSPDDEEVWLLPDYSFYSWPEHVGTYHDVRRRIESVERAVPWDQKEAKLFWRGNMGVGTVDRQAMAKAAAGYEWNDIKPVNWATGENSVKIEDHCKWKYQGFADGNSYSGRLRYLQNCKTVIVTHRPRWLQHWTHLYNANWTSPDQNIVLLPYPDTNASTPQPVDMNADPNLAPRRDHSERTSSSSSRAAARARARPGTEANEPLQPALANQGPAVQPPVGGGVTVAQSGPNRPVSPEVQEDPDLAWSLLPTVMERLLANDTHARLIAENQWDFFRNRYVSPASAACYWRKSIRGYASVQNFTATLRGTETSYESWSLLGMRKDSWREGIQRRRSASASAFA